jgi:hypothetical protein
MMTRKFLPLWRVKKAKRSDASLFRAYSRSVWRFSGVEIYNDVEAIIWCLI